MGLQGVVTCFANRKTDGFDSHKVHQWDIKCVITLAVGYLVASLKPPINGVVAQLGERLPCKQEVTSSNLVFSTWHKMPHVP